MGQKTNPVGNRLGIIRGWDSNWYGGNKYAEKLVEDNKIRTYLQTRLSKAQISKIVIERTLKLVTITVHSARPGLIIGKLGKDIDGLKEELRKFTGKDVQINIYELKRPELDANLVSTHIARQLEGRVSYKKAIKLAIGTSMRLGAKGVKVMISGRIGGAEMARSETYKEGRIPLHTLRADIDYNLGEALTKFGLMGIKVWIFKGEVYAKRDLSPNFGYSPAQSGPGASSYDRPSRPPRNGGYKKKRNK